MAGREAMAAEGERRFRQTEQRRILLEELRRLTTHPTADELFRIVRRRLPAISLATVYRNLVELAERGVILKLATAGEQMRFDGSPEAHYHARCTRCGRVEDLSIAPIGAIRRAARRVRGFCVAGYALEYFGECGRCRGKREA